MNGIVGLVAFCVLCACFLAECFAVMFWARNVELRLERLEVRVGAAGRMATRAATDVKLYIHSVRTLGQRVHDLEAEVGDHRAFLNFVEDCAIEGCSRVDAAESGCDCCNPELD